jgi:hypothetical protein
VYITLVCQRAVQCSHETEHTHDLQQAHQPAVCGMFKKTRKLLVHGITFLNIQ